MSKKNWSIILFFVGALTYFFPRWNGIFSEKSTDITTGEGRIAAMILFVGGLILWYMQDKK